MKKFLFVCTGNTCRSPMASAIFEHLCKKNNLSYSCSSRGIHVLEFDKVSPHATTALQKYDLDISSHIAKQITFEDIKNNDYIITMTKNHKLYLLNISGNQYIQKFFTLCKFSDNTDDDIFDPYGHSLEFYSKCADQIYACLKNIIKKI